MNLPARERPWGTTSGLEPGDYMIRPDKRWLYFVLPVEMGHATHVDGVHRVPLGGDGWTLVSEDPLHVTPSVWFNKDMGRERGEWHGFLQDGQFKQV